MPALILTFCVIFSPRTPFWRMYIPTETKSAILFIFYTTNKLFQSITQCIWIWRFNGFNKSLKKKCNDSMLYKIHLFSKNSFNSILEIRASFCRLKVPKLHANYDFTKICDIAHILYFDLNFYVQSRKIPMKFFIIFILQFFQLIFWIFILTINQDLLEW